MATGETEKDITNRSLEYGMGKEAKKPKDASLSYSGDKPFGDYQSFSKIENTNKPIFDRYVRGVYEAEEALHRVDPYKKEPLKELTDKVNGFLKRHAGLSYEEFVRQAKPGDFEGNDYSTLPKKALKRRLFDHRAFLYLSALDDCEMEGVNVGLLLQMINSEKIPFLKSEQNEPTFDAIFAACKKN